MLIYFFSKLSRVFLHSIKWVVNNTNCSCVEDEFKHFLLENATFVAFYCPYLFSSESISPQKYELRDIKSLAWFTYDSKLTISFAIIHIINFIMISCNDWDYFHSNQQQKQYNKTAKKHLWNDGKIIDLDTQIHYNFTRSDSQYSIIPENCHNNNTLILPKYFNKKCCNVLDFINFSFDMMVLRN